MAMTTALTLLYTTAVHDHLGLDLTPHRPDVLLLRTDHLTYYLNPHPTAPALLDINTLIPLHNPYAHALNDTPGALDQITQHATRTHLAVKAYPVPDTDPMIHLTIETYLGPDHRMPTPGQLADAIHRATAQIEHTWKDIRLDLDQLLLAHATRTRTDDHNPD